jgi:hypothetical protein
MGRQYFKNYNNGWCPINLPYLRGENGSIYSGEWAKYSYKISNGEIEMYLHKDDDELERISTIEDDGAEVWVWNIDEEWKHNLIERLIEDLEIVDIERLIADVGIRKAFKMADDTGFNEAMTMEELSTDMGMKKLFYCVLNEMLEFVPDELDSFEEITEAEWKVYNEREWSDDEESEEEEEEVVVREEQDLNAISGLVATAA